MPPPYYPEQARVLGQEGTVVLRVIISADGTVRQVTIDRSSGFSALDDAAVETVSEQWRFVPAQRGTVAVDSSVLVPIRFTLKEALAGD
jgi:protein TonB